MLLSRIYLGLGPVDEIEFLGGAGEGGVEPVDIVGGEHIVRHIALIEIDVRPLSALRFMAGDGIGKLYLKGVVIAIALHLLDALYLLGDVCIILDHSIAAPRWSANLG